MLLFDQKNVLLNYDIPSALTNFAGKAAYNYAEKYFCRRRGKLQAGTTGMRPVISTDFFMPVAWGGTWRRRTGCNRPPAGSIS